MKTAKNWYCSNKIFEEWLETHMSLVASVAHKYSRWKVEGAQRWEQVPFDEAENICLSAAAHALSLYDWAQVDSKISTYVYSAMKNAMLEYWRKASSKAEELRRFKEQSLKDVENEYDTENVMGAFDDEWMEIVENGSDCSRLKKVIWDALDALDGAEKQVFLLTLDFSQMEVGKFMGKAQSTISKIRQSAILKLRELLKEEVL